MDISSNDLKYLKTNYLYGRFYLVSELKFHSELKSGNFDKNVELCYILKYW